MVTASEQRRLLAIMVADIVGYSSLMARFEGETFQRVKELQSSLMVPAVARNRGEIIKYTGDGFIATFASALDAVRAAVEVQSGAKAAAATAPEDQRILFRIGINVGDVIVVPGDIYGDSVNIAARLQGLAKPGGICVSRSVRDTVKGKFQIDFTDLGNVEVKNIPEAIGTYELNYEAIAWTMERRVPLRGLKSLMRPAWVLAAAGAVAASVIAVAGNVWFWPQAATRPHDASGRLADAGRVADARLPSVAAATPPSSFGQALSERIGALAPDMPDSMRSFHRSSYLQMAQTWPHRAIAVSPAVSAAWRMASSVSASNAEERALEGCQLRYGQPCLTVAVNDALAPANGPPWPVREMPRVSYGGRFEPAMIPAVAIPVRSRPDVAGYEARPGPKAVALHPQGLLHIVTTADSQFGAERRALDACTADPAHEGRNLPCYLYAVGNDVVLPRRTSSPLSTPPAGSGPAASEVLSPAPSGAPPSPPSASSSPKP